jgi:LmbE family N-acetylglucosaminyl deacetylase
MSGTLFAVFPHPDDETFSAGGLMAAAVERGFRVVLDCVTRGEAGESSNSDFDTPEKLGQAREMELAAAMQALGVTEIRHLDYRDSGMAGSPEAHHPQAFLQAPIESVAERLAIEICELQPQIVLTFGEDGVYGHPDHIHTFRAVTQAVLLAADPSALGGQDAPWQTPELYFCTAPREELLELMERPNSPLASMPEDARQKLGTPRDQITHVLDVGAWETMKREAFQAHATQTGPGGPLSGIDLEALDRRLRTEHLVRAPLPWDSPAETDTFLRRILPVNEVPT